MSVKTPPEILGSFAADDFLITQDALRQCYISQQFHRAGMLDVLGKFLAGAPIDEAGDPDPLTIEYTMEGPLVVRRSEMNAERLKWQEVVIRCLKQGQAKGAVMNDGPAAARVQAATVAAWISCRDRIIAGRAAKARDFSARMAGLFRLGFANCALVCAIFYFAFSVIGWADQSAAVLSANLLSEFFG